MIDMTNKKVGLLTVLHRDNTKPTGKGKEVFWICKCECGQLTSVRGSDLRREKTKSCGCLNKQQAKINITHTINHKIKQENKQLLDKTFGFLKVLEVEDNIAKCQCLLCGNICYTKIKYLKNGHKQSCGCLVSKGEAKISQILKENNINFEQQKTFDTCRFLDTNAWLNLIFICLIIICLLSLMENNIFIILIKIGIPKSILKKCKPMMSLKISGVKIIIFHL